MAGFYPAKQIPLKSFQKAWLAGKKPALQKSHFCFDHVKQATCKPANRVHVVLTHNGWRLRMGPANLLRSSADYNESAIVMKRLVFGMSHKGWWSRIAGIPNVWRATGWPDSSRNLPCHFGPPLCRGRGLHHYDETARRWCSITTTTRGVEARESRQSYRSRLKRCINTLTIILKRVLRRTLCRVYTCRFHKQVTERSLFKNTVQYFRMVKLAQCLGSWRG